MVHFDNELPSDVELMNFGHGIDDEVIGGVRERRVRERFAVIEKRECDFGVVFEIDECLG